MKKIELKRILTAALAALLSLSMLLAMSGCAAFMNFINSIVSEYNPYGSSWVKFSQMKYERPDIDAVTEQMRSVGAMIDGSDGKTHSYDDLAEKLYAALMKVVDWNSMESLAFIHYSIDTSDAKWAAEVDFYDENNGVYAQELEALYVACAQSEYKEKFENDIFGAGTLDPYVTGPVITDEIAELMQREAELKSQFAAFDYTKEVFTFEGREGTIDQHAARMSESDTDRYNAMIDKLYEAINKATAPILIELVKVRKEISRLSGYDHYVDYAYENALYRDYTPAQADALVEQIISKVVPIYVDETSSGRLSSYYAQAMTPMSAGKVVDSLEAFATSLGKEFKEVYDFMEKYELYYFGYESTQLDNSLTTYIPLYDSPFILIKGNGAVSDFVEFTHEFGHFTDTYVNYGPNNDLDLSEIASTSLQYILATRADKLNLTEAEKRGVVNYQKFSSVDTYVSQAVYYRFETRLYDMAANELTVENVNKLAADVLREFGLGADAELSSFAYTWSAVYHFYEQPFYTISYINADFASLQIFALELEQEGSGVEKYVELIKWDLSMTFIENLERAGLYSPFSKGAVDKLAANIRKVLAL